MSEKKSPGAQPRPDGPSTKMRGASNNARDQDPYVSGFDILLANGTIDQVLFSEIALCCTTHKKNEGIVLGLVTYGGEANSAYRIGRLLQTLYTTVHVFVPSLCKSAGTLVATAAHQLIISPFGEIGPLDVQLLPRDEISGRRSGLTTRSALADLRSHAFDLYETYMLGIIKRSGGAVSFRLASDLASKATSNVISTIYSQINPESLGQDFRDLSVATEYGTRLATHSKNLRPGAVRNLVHDYPSHDFVIDLEEAKKLFVNVRLPSQHLYKIYVENLDDLMMPRTGPPLVKMVAPVDGEEASDVHGQEQAAANNAEGSPNGRRDPGRAASAP